ncbi:hypothetical protein BH23BAC2_BH23BAC2_17980 [soil metagenome]
MRKIRYNKHGIILSQLIFLSAALYILMGFNSCKKKFDHIETTLNWDSLYVTASAFNSTRAQTGAGNPKITAWGDTLDPGMKIIAVSRDLIAKGLDHNTEVIIEGIDGVFLVKDKMHVRWKNKIDIYMGEDVEMARNFGRRKVKIFYVSSKDSLTL